MQSRISKFNMARMIITNTIEKDKQMSTERDRALQFCIRVLENNMNVKSIINNSHGKLALEYGLAANVFLRDFVLEKFMGKLEIAI